jgi:DNA-binding response OmpR family regulator
MSQQTATPHQPRVLVIDDDRDLAGLVQSHLRDSLCCVDVESDGVSGLGRALTDHYDAIVMDIALPGLDGLSICQTLRQRGVKTPILMLTARTTELDKVLGLEVGADDYMTKPFSLRELQARVKALVRRVDAYSSAPRPSRRLQFDNLQIDADCRRVTCAGQAVDLTAKEFDLLLWFANHPGHVFSRDRLLSAVWGYQYEGYGQTVNSHINRLRAKIERDPAAPEFILTVWSIGYRFRDA